MNIVEKILLTMVFSVSIFIIAFSLPLGKMNDALIPDALAVPEPLGAAVLLATGLYFGVKSLRTNNRGDRFTKD